MAFNDRDLSNLKISESFYRLMQTDPIDDKTLIDGTGSLVTYLAVSGTVDAFYFKGDGSQLTNISASNLPEGLVSSSAQLGLSSSDSPTFAGLTVTGKLTAQEFHTQLVSASIIYESGSTKFGDTLDDTHDFTGSIRVDGGITGSLFGTASFSNLSSTASYIDPLFISASVAAQGLSGVSDWADITNKPAGLVSSSVQTIEHLIGTNIVSGSGQRGVLGLAETDSPTFANANFTNNVVVGGTLTARTYVISSSVIDYQTIQVSGSSKFGDTLDDTHQFTGSLFVTGSINSPSITGSLFGIASTASKVSIVAYGFSGDFPIAIMPDPSDATSTSLGYGLGGLPKVNASTGTITANSFTGSLQGSSSYALTASYALNAGGATIDTSSFATTGSNTFVGNQDINGDLIVTGRITAQEFYTQYVSASIIYESGSTKFGDTFDDVHQFTGSLDITGSLIINGTSYTAATSGTSGTSGESGSSGSSGTSGSSGSSGTSGSSGISGSSGSSGSSGTSGESGSSGTSGSSGSSGTSGSSGSSGTSGESGSSGTSGSSGSSGTSGSSGSSGTSGSSGSSGTSGSSGSSGTSGSSGSSGTSGSSGSSGTSGSSGSSGTSGSSGSSGTSGSSGSSGTSGSSGSSGTSGESGSSGTSGSSGSSGTSGSSGSSGSSGTSGTGFNTISNSLDNRVLTSDGTSNAANAETNLVFDGSTLTVTGDAVVTGKLTAQEFYTEYVSASIIYESGSTKFGDSSDDTHKFTGSLYVTGALVIPTIQTLPVTADTGSVAIFNNSLYIYF